MSIDVLFYPLNPINPCSKKKKLAVVTRTRIKRIDADEIEYQYIKIVLLSGCLVVWLFSCLVVCHVNTFNKITKQQNHYTTKFYISPKKEKRATTK